MSENLVRRKFSRYIDFKQYVVRELVLAGVLKLVPLRTHKMVADARTKSLLEISASSWCGRQLPTNSSGTDRSWLVKFLLPLASYVASWTNFEYWHWALRFHILFLLIDFFFSSPSTLHLGVFCCDFFLRFFFMKIFRHVSQFLFFCWFAQCCLFKIPVHWEEQYSTHGQDLSPRVRWATPTNEILSRIKTFSLDPFRSNVPFGKSLSQSSSREKG